MEFLAGQYPEYIIIAERGMNMGVVLVAMSDAHLRNEQFDISVPEGDILIHAGDATVYGSADEVRRFSEWFAAFPHPHKIFIAGNHDLLFEKDASSARALLHPSITYLLDSEVLILGLRIYGSPWQPRFGNWAFNLGRGLPLREKWDRIPGGLDILVTHGPPLGICDWSTRSGGHVGCADLRDAVLRTKPRYHIFGHIHEGYGTWETPDTSYANVSICSGEYPLMNKPLVTVLDV